MNIQIFKTYSHQGLCRSLDVFNFPSDYSSLTRILGYRFLFQYKHLDPKLIPSHTNLVKSIKQMVIEHLHIPEKASVLMDIVDILLEFSKPDGQELLTYLQKTKITANKNGASKDGTNNTLYADSQSTHNETISNNLKQIAKYLCDNFNPRVEKLEKIALMKNIEIILTNIDQKSNKTILDVLERIYSDNAIFEGYNVDIILFSLFNYVSKQPSIQSQIYKRIHEELLEMHNYCSTRILGGLLNSLQGFTKDDKLIIKISIEDQCKAVVYTYLDKMLKECKDDKILDGMINKNKNYKDFIIFIINKKRIEWNKEYGDEFSICVSNFVNTYTDMKIFT